MGGLSVADNPPRLLEHCTPPVLCTSSAECRGTHIRGGLDDYMPTQYRHALNCVPRLADVPFSHFVTAPLTYGSISCVVVVREGNVGVRRVNVDSSG